MSHIHKQYGEASYAIGVSGSSAIAHIAPKKLSAALVGLDEKRKRMVRPPSSMWNVLSGTFTAGPPNKDFLSSEVCATKPVRYGTGEAVP